MRDGRDVSRISLSAGYAADGFTGQCWLGDYRWDNLIEMLGTAMLIAKMWPTAFGRAVALLFLFTPRAPVVLRNGWTEPSVTLLLAATVLSAQRRSGWTPWLLGLLLASKQYMFIVATSALFMLRPRKSGWTALAIWCGKVLLAGMLVSLPLILWNPAAYIRSNFAAAAGAGFRYDAMSYLAYWADTHNWTPPMWIGAVSLMLAVPATIVAIKRFEPTAGGFAAACAVVMVFFFAFNKFAFANYFYLVIATICISINGSQPQPIAKELVESEPELRLAA